MTLFDLLGNLNWVIVVAIIVYVYMVIVKANLGANEQPKDYQQMKQQDAQRAQQRAQNNQTQTVEQTTTTTTTTTTLGQWENPSQAINREDSRVSYNDPVGNDSSTNNASLDSFEQEQNRAEQERELEQARNGDM